ncbi:enolase C-terminal domain-like protein [uncultured Rubinisphaera sp.]|uniref:mandelate racemase/muconate lactonizing enzyme family protein n=1 Tax=uncultured Rubinisphaera sp. TaxID=1678686 RepID=UPI0030DC5A55
MRIIRLEPFLMQIPLLVSFKHASAERRESFSIWVEAHDEEGNVGFGEGCPRLYVTGEDAKSCRDFWKRYQRVVMESITSLETLQLLERELEKEIDKAPACWCAIEMAVLDLMSRRAGRTLEEVLGLAKLDSSFRFTAVLGDQPIKQFTSQLQQYVRLGFEQFKIKLSGEAERDRLKFQALEAAGIAADHVRVDANNLWNSALDALEHLVPFADAFSAVEEPVAAYDYSALNRLAEQLGKPVILDESFLRQQDFSQLSEYSDRWIINIRVSKMGGLLRSLMIIEEARRRDIRVVVGAQVGESSLVTRYALPVATAAGALLFGQEGAFGTHLLVGDVVEPPLMFGQGGMLELDDMPYGRRPMPVVRPDVYLTPLFGERDR